MVVVMVWVAVEVVISAVEGRGDCAREGVAVAVPSRKAIADASLRLIDVFS